MIWPRPRKCVTIEINPDSDIETAEVGESQALIEQKTLQGEVGDIEAWPNQFNVDAERRKSLLEIAYGYSTPAPEPGIGWHRSDNPDPL
jgi:hypothetical protein